MEENDQLPQSESRSAKKRDAKSIEQLARDLVELPDAELARLPVPSSLMQVLMQTRQTKGHGSRKRQLKFFAGLLRKDAEQTEELRAYVAGDHQSQRDENRLTHQLEQMREKLCAPDSRTAAFSEARELLPRLDVIELQRLLNGYRGADDKKNYRQIFRCLRAASDAGHEE
ncbi:MAG: DUF615 domain-containing protein [Desulfuromonas sp.]|nr:DUF615 domain-containing protein [Desulfuromonas sp.]